jgi:hypothetical protein
MSGIGLTADFNALFKINSRTAGFQREAHFPGLALYEGKWLIGSPYGMTGARSSVNKSDYFTDAVNVCLHSEHY